MRCFKQCIRPKSFIHLLLHCDLLNIVKDQYDSADLWVGQQGPCCFEFRSWFHKDKFQYTKLIWQDVVYLSFERIMKNHTRLSLSCSSPLSIHFQNVLSISSIHRCISKNYLNYDTTANVSSISYRISLRRKFSWK